MGRRRRKQEKAERDLAAGGGQGELQGELLADDPAWSVAPPAGPPKPLVEFEMVDGGDEQQIEVTEAPPEPEPAAVEAVEIVEIVEVVEVVEVVAVVEVAPVPLALDPEPEPEPPPPAPRPTADARFRLARELYAAGRVNEAMAVFREVAEREPQSLKARHNLGVLYDELGHHDLAIEQFEASRLLEPDNVDVLVNLGSAIGSLGRFDEAEGVLLRAQKLSPDAVPVRAALGVLSFRRGLYQQAEVELKWVCEHAPDHGPAHFYRGEALNRLGRVDLALEVLELASRIQPKNHRIWYTMGIVCDRKNMREEAAAMYRKARELQQR